MVDLDDKSMIGHLYQSAPILMEAPLVSTGKGFHIYLTWKHEVRTRHIPGVDLIGNGYVVCPPSVHPSGKPCRFIIPLTSPPPEVDPGELLRTPFFTKSLEPLVRSAPTARQESQRSGSPWDLDTCGAITQGAREGLRHTSIVRYLGMLFAGWRTKEEALAIILEWNKLNTPPLPEREVVSTVSHCYREWAKKREKKLKEKNDAG